MANNNDKFISRENAKTLWGYMIDLLTGKQNKLTFDDTPTQSSDNPVKSGGIFTALAGKGTYSKPQNGIPKADLESTVQTSLGKADTALQSFTETDPTVPSWAKQTNKPSYSYSEIQNTPTLGTASAKDVPASGNASSTQVVMGDDTRLSDARTPTAHNQASSTINAMTSYSKPSSEPATPAIQTSDSLNTAIGKLEYKADTNQTNILSAESMVCDNAFSTSTAYAEGDIVTYDHKLYKFKTAHSAGAWNSSQVDQISTTGLITPELIELVDSGAKNQLNITGTPAAGSPFTVSNGVVSINGSVTSTTTFGLFPTYVPNSFKGMLLCSDFDYSDDRFKVYIVYSNNGTSQAGLPQYLSKEAEVISSEYEYLTINIQILANKSASNVKFTPMICTLPAWNVSHKIVPYRPNWDLVCSNAYGYRITSNDATIANLVFNAATACGLSTSDAHAGMISVSTVTDNQYLLVYFLYKHQSIGRGISVANNTITLSAINNLGTLAFTGGTAPYRIGVQFFY